MAKLDPKIFLMSAQAGLTAERMRKFNHARKYIFPQTFMAKHSPCPDALVAAYYVRAMEPWDLRTEAAKARGDIEGYQQALIKERSKACALRKHLTERFGDTWRKECEAIEQLHPRDVDRLVSQFQEKHG